MKNYYKVLGVDVLSPPEDIKRAYRKMAKTYHPDRNPDDPDANFKFQEATEAYEVLSDPDERFKYDRQLKYVIIPNTTCDSVTQITKSHIKVKTTFMIVCAIIIVLGLLFIMRVSYLQNSKTQSLQPGMTLEALIEAFGEPSEKHESQWMYQNSIVIIKNDKVAGWYDIDNHFKIKNKDIEHSDEIVVGEELNQIFNVYGYPDIYGQTFLVYNSIVILYQNNKVTEVYEIK